MNLNKSFLLVNIKLLLLLDQCSDSRYKLMVQVILGERHGAGVKSIARCIWDADTDALAFDQFLNVSVIK